RADAPEVEIVDPEGVAGPPARQLDHALPRLTDGLAVILLVVPGRERLVVRAEEELGEQALWDRIGVLGREEGIDELVAEALDDRLAELERRLHLREVGAALEGHHPQVLGLEGVPLQLRAPEIRRLL